MHCANNSKHKLRGMLCILLLLSGLNLSACEREAKITVENESSQDVTIYATVVFADGTLDKPTFQGTVTANSTKTLSVILIRDEDVKRIEARNPSGKIVFSGDYNRAGLEKTGWRIIIPP